MEDVNCVCGNTYDPDEVEIPEGASIYWVPICTECRTKITSAHNMPSRLENKNSESSPVGSYDIGMVRDEWGRERALLKNSHLWTRWAIKEAREGERLPVAFKNGWVRERDDLNV